MEELEKQTQATSEESDSLDETKESAYMDSPDKESEPESTNGPENTITFKRSHLYSVLIPLAFVVGLSTGYLLWGQAAERRVTAQTAPAAQANTQSQGNSSQPQTSNQQVTRYDVPVDDDPVLGPEDAAITIIEFSDYECPYCQRWHDEVYYQLLDEYEGQIRFVYRDFPLNSIHPNASPAAEAANCAGEQNTYWEYHDKLFGMTRELGSETYQQYASELNLDMEAFNECLESGRHQEEIEADFEYASNLGVRSTPTFFINGIPIVGAQPYEVFKQVIDKELAGEIP